MLFIFHLLCLPNFFLLSLLFSSPFFIYIYIFFCFPFLLFFCHFFPPLTYNFRRFSSSYFFPRSIWRHEKQLFVFSLLCNPSCLKVPLSLGFPFLLFIIQSFSLPSIFCAHTRHGLTFFLSTCSFLPHYIFIFINLFIYLLHVFFKLRKVNIFLFIWLQYDLKTMNTVASLIYIFYLLSGSLNKVLVICFVFYSYFCNLQKSC